MGPHRSGWQAAWHFIEPQALLRGAASARPEEIYNHVRNVAPDLIVHFGGLSWRPIGGAGYPTIHVRENDTGPDDCNHAQHGSFVLAGLNNPLQGLIEGAHLLDIAPTLLEQRTDRHGDPLPAGATRPRFRRGGPDFSAR